MFGRLVWGISDTFDNSVGASMPGNQYSLGGVSDTFGNSACACMTGKECFLGEVSDTFIGNCASVGMPGNLHFLGIDSSGNIGGLMGKTWVVDMVMGWWWQLIRQTIVEGFGEGLEPCRSEVSRGGVGAAAVLGVL